jgi:hypothetical protein
MLLRRVSELIHQHLRLHALFISTAFFAAGKGRWRRFAFVEHAMAEKRRVSGSAIPLSWRLTWWDFTGFLRWVGRVAARKGSAVEPPKFKEPAPQVVEFYSERLARKFINDKRAEASAPTSFVDFRDKIRKRLQEAVLAVLRRDRPELFAGVPQR